MSISDKITSITGHLQDDYTALEQLGVSVEDRNIENIKDMANQIYAKFPKTDYAEGSNITLSNTLKGKLDFEDDNGKKIVGIGQSSQDTTEGYNELNIYAVHNAGYTETVSGVTFTYNDDGSVTANGKATADINFFLGSRASLGNIFNGTYYLSGCTTGSNTTYYLSMWADGIGVYPQTTTEVATNKTSGVNWNIVIAVKNGATINYTFYPMMSATSGKTYEKYSGGYSSPSPNWEQQVKCVRGRNRLKLENGTTTMHNVTSVTENGKITLNGTPNSTDYINLIGTYVANTTDTFTLTPFKSATNSDIRLLYTINDGSLVNSDNTPQISLTIGDILKVYLRISSTSQITNFTLQPQLEEGSTVTSYLPYNTLEVVERGKNWLEAKLITSEAYGITLTNNNNGTFSISGTNTRGSVVGFRIDQSTYVGTDNLKDYANGTYTIDLGITNSNIRAILMQQDTYIPMLSANYGTRLNSGTLTNATNMFFLIQVKEGADFNTPVTIKPMLVKGSYTSETIGDFQPYITPQKYQLSLGEYEFAKIGDYADELLYDVDNDKVYKNEKIGEVALKSTLGWIQAPSSVAEGTTRFYCNKSDVANLQAIQTKDVLSNGFIPLTWNEIYIGDTTTKNAISDYSQLDSVANRIVLRIDNNYASSVNELNTFLDNNNFYACYVKTEPTLTELTDTTLKQQVKNWYYAQSNNGTTIIESNGDLPLIIKCRALKGE